MTHGLPHEAACLRWVRALRVGVEEVLRHAAVPAFAPAATLRCAAKTDAEDQRPGAWALQRLSVSRQQRDDAVASGFLGLVHGLISAVEGILW